MTSLHWENDVNRFINTLKEIWRRRSVHHG
jgi:hypothetical protein